jgi:glycerol-3-phosphate cytidylyltransferase
VLVVAVSTDRFNAAKGKAAVVPFADRLEMVRACRHVDHAIAEDGWDQKERDIVHYGVDLFVMGDDWIGRFDHLVALCDVCYLPRTEGVSSTELKRDIRRAMPGLAAG